MYVFLKGKFSVCGKCQPHVPLWCRVCYSFSFFTFTFLTLFLFDNDCNSIINNGMLPTQMCISWYLSVIQYFSNSDLLKRRKLYVFSRKQISCIYQALFNSSILIFWLPNKTVYLCLTKIECWNECITQNKGALWYKLKHEDLIPEMLKLIDICKR